MINKIKEKNLLVGISVKPNTPLDDKLFDILDKNLIDNFLVMTVGKIYNFFFYK